MKPAALLLFALLFPFLTHSAELPRPFAMGADLSLMKFIEDHGVKYRENGVAKDPLAIFKEHGCNYVRLRLFVNPDGTGGQVNTLPYTVAMAKRVKSAGLRFLLDLHYSDKWADPGHQSVPEAWKNLTEPELIDRTRLYTKEVLTTFKNEACLPDMVQIGNEITNGLMWPAGGPITDAKWETFGNLLKAGIKGVRDVDPENHIQIMIHTDRGGDKGVSGWFFKKLTSQSVPFDVIGLTYYPFWSGGLENLSSTLADLSKTYQKDIVVVETGNNWSGDPKASPYPQTPEGQKAFLEGVIHTVAATPGGHGKGVFYWSPDWTQSKEWDAGPGAGQWEDRALFDRTGNMLPAMEAFLTKP